MVGIQVIILDGIQVQVDGIQVIQLQHLLLFQQKAMDGMMVAIQNIILLIKTV